MQQPPGFINSDFLHLVYKLRKSLYKLKQAPRAWFDKLFQALHNFGFKQSSYNASLFALKALVLVIVLLYVDEILVTGPNAFIYQKFIH